MNETEQTKTKRVFKLRRKYKPLEPQKKFSKTVKVAKRLKGNNGVPPPGTLEEDFILEHEGNPTDFLTKTSQVSNPEPVFDDTGKIIPWKVVGPTDVIEKYAKEKYPTPTPKTSKLLEQRGFPKPKSTKVRYEERLNQIYSREALTSQRPKRRRKILFGKDIREDQQEKCLQNYQDTLKRWSGISAHLSRKVKKGEEELAFNRVYEYRDKKETRELLDKVTPNYEKVGQLAWNISLRDWKGTGENGETFVPLGNYFSGLYSCLRPSSSTPLEYVRPATSYKPKNRTIKDSEYFKRKVSGADLRPDLDLKLSGSSKLQLEKEAIEKLGSNQVDLGLLADSDSEEVIVSNYSPNVLY